MPPPPHIGGSTHSSFASAPVEDFELHGAATIEFIDLRRAGELEAAGWQRVLGRIPPDGFGGDRAVGDPEFGVLLFAACSRKQLRKPDIATFRREFAQRCVRTPSGEFCLPSLETVIPVGSFLSRLSAWEK